MQTPKFFGFDNICATYNRGMAQDIIFDRVELAQPHKYSWPTAPYHANIRKSLQHNLCSNKLPDMTSGLSVLIFFIMFSLPMDHVASVLKKNMDASKPSEHPPILIRKFLVRKINKSVTFFLSHKSWQSENITLHGGLSRSWSAEQGKENKRESLAAHPPLPHGTRSEKKKSIT